MLQRMRVGELDIPNSPLIVQDMRVVHEMVGEPIDGILGTTFLSVFPVLFDFTNREITVSWGVVTTAEVRQTRGDSYIELPLRDTGNFGFLARAKIRGTDEVELMVDSGTPRTVISKSTARILKLKDTEVFPGIHTLHGNANLHRVVISRLSFAGVDFHDLEVDYADPPNDAFQPHIGLDVLSHFRMLIDISAKKLYLTPSRQEAVKPPTA